MIPRDLPKYHELMLPVLTAVAELGGSGNAREITGRVLELLAPTEAELALQYPTREKSVYVDRLEWARSYCKLGGALKSPRRVCSVDTLGRETLALPEREAQKRLRDLDPICAGGGGRLV